MNRCQWAVAITVLAWGAMLAGCSEAPLDYPRTASSALAQPGETQLGKMLAPQLAAHPGESGFQLLATGPEGLAARLAVIQLATKTIDAQYFLLEDDCAGNLFLGHLLAAADRGVRVRLLVDDWDQTGSEGWLAGIDAHPNVEVRLFNPFGNPRSARFLQYGFGPSRLKKRMHNKSLIVDNTLAVAGGRNIADEYFEMGGDYAFKDTDLLIAGPTAREASDSFDAYWNDRLSLPIKAVLPNNPEAQSLEQAHRKFEQHTPATCPPAYIRDLHESELREKIASGSIPWIWAKGQYLHDLPIKIVKTMEDEPSAYMAVRLREVLDTAKTEILMSSPYLVPGEGGMTRIRQLRDRGVKISILTNSLASTDEAAPFGGYQQFRKDMLRAGVSLFELKPVHTLVHEPHLHQGQPDRTGLHAKIFIMDRWVTFVGSFNFDPRSRELDTQDGVIIWSETIAAQVTERWARAASPAHSYRVAFVGSLRGSPDERLVWIAQEDGKTTQWFEEPETDSGRRFDAWFLGLIIPQEWL